jgi:hypothetical protein
MTWLQHWRFSAGRGSCPEHSRRVSRAEKQPNSGVSTPEGLLAPNLGSVRAIVTKLHFRFSYSIVAAANPLLNFEFGILNHESPVGQCAAKAQANTTVQK